MKKFGIHLILSLLLFLVAVIFTSPLVFFVSDVGLRYLQIQNLIAHNWKSFAINYPAASIDPYFEFVPYYYAYSIINHEIFVNISPFLPFFSSILYKSMDIAGLALIPVLGALFTGLAIKQLFKFHNLPYPDLMFWLTIFVTPILFYSLQIWDHTIGVAFSTWAVYFAVKGIKINNSRDIFLAGVLLGLGTGQRPELLVFLIASTVGLLITGNFKFAFIGWFFSGVAIGVVPIWISQYLWFGHPLGIVIGGQLFGYGVPEHYPFYPVHRLGLPRFTKISLLLYQVDHSQPVLNVLTLLFLCSGIFLLVIAFRKRQKILMVFIGLSLFVLGYLLILIPYVGQPIQGILSTFPLIPLSIILIPQRDADDQQNWKGYQFIGLSTFIFIIAILFFWPADGGLQWGSRYLLPVYPLLFYMAIFTFSQLRKRMINQWRKALQITTITLIVISIVLQVMSVNTLWNVYNHQIMIRGSITNLPVKHILTNAPYLQSYLTSTDKIFLYVDNSEILTNALNRLATEGYYDFAVIPLEHIKLYVPDQIRGYRIEKVSEFVYHLNQQ